LAKQLFGYAILSFALTKAITLFALMMALYIYIYCWCWYFGGNKYIFVAPYLQSKESCILCLSWVEGCAQKIFIFYFPNKMSTSGLNDSYV